MNYWKGATRSHDSWCGADVGQADAQWPDGRHAAGCDCLAALAPIAAAQFRHAVCRVVFCLDLHNDSAVSGKCMENGNHGFNPNRSSESSAHHSRIMGGLYVHDLGHDCGGGPGARDYRNMADL